MGEANDSVTRGGGVNGGTTSTIAGAGQGAGVRGSMGAEARGRDVAKVTISTAAAAGGGGGGVATGSKAAAFAVAGGDKDGSTISAMVGAATCSEGG